MKPRLALLFAFYDCGWRYELWRCEGWGQIGFGGSPGEAYRAWGRAYE